jgi:hypothetical protein
VAILPTAIAGAERRLNLVGAAPAFAGTVFKA